MKVSFIKVKRLILFIVLFVSFFVCSGFEALAGEEIKVRSEKITVTIWHFDFEGKNYITLGDSKKSIQVGYQEYQVIEGYKVLMHKGMGEKDAWIGSTGDKEYKKTNGTVSLIADLAYHTVTLDGTGRKFQMRKPSGSNIWEIALTDGKIYHEKNGVLEHAGYQELRKVYHDDKELYLTMHKDLSSKSPWQGEYDGKTLVSYGNEPMPATISKPSKTEEEKPVQKQKYKGIPNNVVSYRYEKQVSFSELVFDNGKIKVDFVDKYKKPFTLVALFQFKDQALAVYTDDEKTQTMHSSGKTLLGFYGRDKKESESKGSISIKVEKSVYGVYSLSFSDGMVSVFAMEGKVDDVFSRALNDEAEFDACSNVLVKIFPASAESSTPANTIEQTAKTVKELQKTVEEVQKTIQAVQQTKVQQTQETTKNAVESGKKPEEKTEMQGKLFELTEIKAFEQGKESIERDNRRYTDSFFKDSTRSIFLEAVFKNFYYNKSIHTHKLNYIWHNPDGSIRGKTDYTLEVKSEWDVFWYTAGWGWDDPGNWPLGEYAVEVFVDDQKIGEKKFSVIEKGFELTQISFFENGDTISEVSKREYLKRFNRASTRFVNTEISFKNLWYQKKDQQYKITRVWYDINDAVERVKDYDLIIKSDWESSIHTGEGWGWPDPGKWSLGAYRVEIYVNNNLIDEGWFRIVDN